MQIVPLLNKSKPRGTLFQIPCCKELVVLCVKGDRRPPYVWQGIKCSKCQQTATAVLEHEPQWAYAVVPDPYKEIESALYMVTLLGYAKWVAEGMPDWRL